MAILVQRVSGFPYRRYFFPPLTGVAFSHNLYRWSDKIDPAQGMVRLVFGLGTRAVNRVGGDYPRMIALSHPRLRPEVGKKIVAYSQRSVDLLDLAQNSLVTAPLSELLDTADYPELFLYVSQAEDGYVQDPVGPVLQNLRAPVLTFNNLMERTDFVKIMREMLAKLETAYGYPLDTEFTAFAGPQGQVRINLLQCRPMQLPIPPGVVAIPENIPPERVLFRAHRMISAGVVSDIRYIVYINPAAYAHAPLELKKTLGRVVGRVNRHPELTGCRFMIMGPGRWGSSNLELGVNVTYADINNTSVLVEIAREETGQVPELSYGTHFFQDLVEANIIYLPVYPSDPDSAFNHDFFENAPNILADLLPDAADFAETLKVIAAPAVAGGKLFTVVADPRNYQAICFIPA